MDPLCCLGTKVAKDTKVYFFIIECEDRSYILCVSLAKIDKTSWTYGTSIFHIFHIVSDSQDPVFSCTEVPEGFVGVPIALMRVPKGTYFPDFKVVPMGFSKIRKGPRDRRHGP